MTMSLVEANQETVLWPKTMEMAFLWLGVP